MDSSRHGGEERSESGVDLQVKPGEVVGGETAAVEGGAEGHLRPLLDVRERRTSLACSPYTLYIHSLSQK